MGKVLVQAIQLFINLSFIALILILIISGSYPAFSLSNLNFMLTGLHLKLPAIHFPLRKIYRREKNILLHPKIIDRSINVIFILVKHLRFIETKSTSNQGFRFLFL